MKHPNIIVLICDDLCWGDIARHGNPVVRTPELDRLHDESRRCQRWCSGPLCSPARASLMTGRWHLRTRVLDTYCGRSIIDPDEPTLGRVFGAAGYATGCFGKWHLGDCHPCRPEDLGFGETLWHRSGGLGQPGDFPANHARWGTDAYFDPILVRDGTAECVSGYCTDIFTDATIAFATRHREHPFLAYLAFNAPHSPLQVADAWADPYRQLGLPEEHARLYGMVANIDWNVGRLRAALRELGLDRNTLLLFTSDHGPCGSAGVKGAPEGRRGRWNAGMRGSKGTVYEGGIRVPAFWYLPDRFTPGTVIEPTHPIDVLPTLCSLAGVAPPVDWPVDGVDLLPALSGTAPVPERLLFMQWHRGDVPIPHRNRAVIDRRWKLVRPDAEAPDELYDLWRDPAETYDCAAEQPDEVERLRRAYEAWLSDVGATRGAGTFDGGPIVVGSEAEPRSLLTEQDWRLRGREAWLCDDIRGVWLIEVARSANYRLRACWRTGAPDGAKFLRLGGQILQLSPAEPDGWSAIEVQLPAGRSEWEAWLETPVCIEGLRNGRFLAAMYVEVSAAAG